MRNGTLSSVLPLSGTYTGSSRGRGNVWPPSRQAGVDLPQDLASSDKRRLAADGHWLSEAVR